MRLSGFKPFMASVTTRNSLILKPMMKRRGFTLMNTSLIKIIGKKGS